MTERTDTKTLRRDALFAVANLLLAIALLVFMDGPPDVRPGIWLAVRIGYVALAATHLAFCTWRLWWYARMRRT